MSSRRRTALVCGACAGGAALLAAGLFMACASESLTRPALLGSAAPGTALPRIETSAAPSVTTPTAAEPLNLEEFAPLLSLPELAEVARQVELEQPGAAARELVKLLQHSPPATARGPHWQYLLGRLWEQAQDPVAAASAYRQAAVSSYPLAGYARLALGRVLIRAGKFAEASQALAQVPGEIPAAAPARLLAAEAAFGAGQPELAIAHWRQHLASREEPEDWPRVSLELARLLLTPVGATVDGGAPPAPSGDATARAEEALRLARRVAARRADDASLVKSAAALEAEALALLPAARASALRQPSAEEQLQRVERLVEVRQAKEAIEAADALLLALGADAKHGAVGCQAALARGKALALQRQWGRAADSFVDLLRHCDNQDDLRVKVLYLAGKYAFSDKRYTLSIQRYEQLEKEFREHRLADDARLNAALAYLELGVEARFTELLSRMPDDYPAGDMLLEGMFRLALRRIERNDWSGAASVLERAAAIVGDRDSARGHEFSGRERYFRARALMQTGERDRGKAELEAIVRELPLSYYMLHAYSRLVELEPFRAKQVRDEAMAEAAAQPFRFEHRAEFELPGFRRGLELLRQGELDFAKREFDALGFNESSTAPGVLWGMALLYERAGAAQRSHAIARGLLTDWLQRWPAGDWTRAWELAFPRPYLAIVEREAKKNDVPQALVFAVMREESAFDPGAVSSADAYGLMQLIEPTARSAARKVGLPSDPQSLKRPAINIALGSRVLNGLLARFSDNPWLAIPGYNAGPGRPVRWLRERPQVDFDVWVETIPYLETRRYTKRVLASNAAYTFLYEQNAADPVMALPIRLTPPATTEP